MNDLTQDLRDYRAYLNEQLALAEKATAGPWREMPAETSPATSFIKSKDGCVAHHAWKRDADFIAAARNGYEPSIRAQLRMLEGLERMWMTANWGLNNNDAHETLRDIIAAWKGGRA